VTTDSVSGAGKTLDPNQYPSARYAWFMVIMLTLAYILSFVDRYIFGLLVEPIKADFDLTDTQVGLLMGPAFGIVYATMGLPIGWLADRKRRTLILAAGIALWSVATTVTGLAKTFTHIFAARMSVGVGEAALSPVAMSIISDSFEPKSRGKPIAFYTAALTLGAGIASLVAAGVLTWAKSGPQIELPIIGVLAPWQFIFIIVGLPGVILAVIFALLREPTRIKEADDDAATALGLKDMLTYVFQRFGAFFGIIAMVGSMLVVVYSQGWMAATFERTWGWSAERYVFVNAIIMLSLGPLTVNLAGWLSDRLYQKGHRDAPYLIMLTGMSILVPSAIAATLMPSPTLAFVFLAINLVGIALASAVGPTALLNITPSNIRAQVTALYYMIISLLGLMLGPLTVSLLSDHVFGNENLRFAVSAVPVIFGVPALLFGFYGRGAYVRELNKI